MTSTAYFFSFFFNLTATTHLYTLSLHDALPISVPLAGGRPAPDAAGRRDRLRTARPRQFVDDRVFQRDRKSTRLNSSHTVISYAVFCLKKKKKKKIYQKNNTMKRHKQH